jgi:hypothetical protein
MQERANPLSRDKKEALKPAGTVAAEDSDAVVAGRISRVLAMKRRSDQVRHARIAVILVVLGLFLGMVVLHLNIRHINLGIELWLVMGVCGLFIYCVSTSLRPNRSICNEILSLSSDTDPRALCFLLLMPLEYWAGGHRAKTAAICAMMSRPGFVFPQPVPADIRVKLRALLRNICKYASTPEDVTSARRIALVLSRCQCDADDLEAFRSIGKYDTKTEHQVAIRNLVIQASRQMSEHIAQCAHEHHLVRPASPECDDSLLRAAPSSGRSEADRTSLGRAHEDGMPSADATAHEQR